MSDDDRPRRDAPFGLPGFRSVLPVQSRAATYVVTLAGLLHAVEGMAGKLPVAWGAPWQLDGHKSDTLYLRSPSPDPRAIPDLRAEFGLEVGAQIVTVTVLTRSPDLLGLHDALTGLLDPLLVRRS